MCPIAQLCSGRATTRAKTRPTVRATFGLRSCLCVVALTSTARLAAATEPPVELEWNVPAGEHCPSARAVLDQVSKLVESSPSNERAVVRARADVRKLGEGRFRVELTTLVAGEEGKRVIEERSCSAMAEATVLILAWMVDPKALDAVPAQPEQPQPPAAPARIALPPPSRRGAPRLVFAAAALGDLGTLPNPAVGVGFQLGARWSRLRLDARGGLWAGQTVHVNGLDAGASFGLLTLGVDACVAPLEADLAVCAGPELERLEGTGFGVDSPRTDSVTWLAFALGAQGRVGLMGPLGLTGALRLIVPTRRETFGLDEIGVLHRPGPVSGRVELGLSVLF